MYIKEIRIVVFEWDEDKNIANIRKHGISFDDAVFVFKDPYLLEAYDKKHSSLDEDRWYAIGFAERILCVVFIERLGTIRIISARLATKKEINEYYKKNNA